MGLIWLIILPLLTAFSLGIIKLYWKSKIDLIVVAAGTGHLLLAVKLAAQAFQHPLVYSLGEWQGIWGIQLRIDGFAALMIVLTSGLAYLVLIYSVKFIQVRKTKYYVLFFLLLVGLMGMIMTADLFNLYVFLEVTSLAGYGLILVNKRDRSIEGGFKYLILGSLSGIFILLAIILTYQAVGSLNLMVLGGRLKSAPEVMRYTILTFFLVGFGIKAALVPFHSWLPDAYTEALAPVSVLSSGLIIKVFLTSLLRLIYLLYGREFLVFTPLQPVLIYWGVITFLTAHLLAYQQTNLRRLLGYSSIAQIGYITVAFGLGTEQGTLAANYHLLNHAVMKGALFLAAGLFTAATGSYQLQDVKGLARKLPVVTVGFTTAALAIVGLPPLNGFISKWLIIKETLAADYAVVGFLIIVGTVLALTYYLRVIDLLYSADNGQQLKITQPSWQLKLPIIVLGAACLVLGLGPGIVIDILEKTVNLGGNNWAEFLLGG